MKRQFVIAASIWAAATASQAAPCDVLYQIQAEDTLNEISFVAYGFRDYQLIYSRNLKSLPSLAKLPLGQEIVIPCQPGELGLSPDAVALTFRMLAIGDFTSLNKLDTPTIAEVPSSATANLALLTMNDHSGLAGEDLTDGGIVPAIVSLALASNDQTAVTTSLSFIDDKDAHLETLLPQTGFVLSFPWHKPDCSRAIGASDVNQLLCRKYVFSEPIFDVAFSIITQQGRAPSRDEGFGAISRMKFCALDGADLDMLKQQGSVAQEIDLLKASSIVECFDHLAAGKVDALIANAISVEATLSARGDTDLFEEVPWLGGVTSLHAVALRNNDDGIVALNLLNDGLNKIKADGNWFKLVAQMLGGS